MFAGNQERGDVRESCEKPLTCRFVDWLFLGSAKAFRNILLMWNSRIAEKLYGAMGLYYVSCKFKNVGDQLLWMSSEMYGPNLARDRSLMWDELSGLRCWWKVP